MDLIRRDADGQRLLFPIRGFSRRRQPSPPPAHRHVDTSQACTIDELVQATGLLTQSVCPVVNQLSREGLIIDSGERRPTRTNTPAKVWTVTKEGKRT